jgi:hypothetical protein
VEVHDILENKPNTIKKTKHTEGYVEPKRDISGRSASTETTKNHTNYENYPEYGNYENYGRGLVGCEGGISRNRCMSMYEYVCVCEFLLGNVLILKNL